MHNFLFGILVISQQKPVCKIESTKVKRFYVTLDLNDTEPQMMLI